MKEMKDSYYAIKPKLETTEEQSKAIIDLFAGRYKLCNVCSHPHVVSYQCSNCDATLSFTNEEHQREGYLTKLGERK